MTEVELSIQALVDARRNRATTAAPELSDEAMANAVQAGVARAMGWFDQDEMGESAPCHWKSGGASREAPLSHAPLPPAGIWASPADARNWHFQLRGVEAEIALRIGSDVTAAQAATLDQRGAAALIDAMCVAIELVDSRWSEGLQAPALARLADQQSHGALVLGEWRPFEAHDWTAQRCSVQIGARAALEFAGSHSLNDPAWLLPDWLRHATQGGRTVRAGSVVTTGNWCGSQFAAAGERVLVGFPGVGRAEVQL